MLHKLYYSIYCIQYLILHVTTATSLHRNNTHRSHNLQQYYTFTHWHCLWNEMTPRHRLSDSLSETASASEEKFWAFWQFWLLSVETVRNLRICSVGRYPRPSLWVWSDPRSQRWHQCYCVTLLRVTVTVADSQGCCSAAQRQYTVYTLYSSSTACAAHCCC